MTTARCSTCRECDRAAAAADALMQAYRPDPAWWQSSWWNSAVAITTVADWMKKTGRTGYRWAVDRTYEVNKGVFPAGVKSSDPIEGHFISRAIDDAAWWGIAWVQAYDLTGERKYLDEAVIIGNYVHQFWDTAALDTERRLADAAIGSTVLTRSGILTEACEPSCDDNGKQVQGHLHALPG